MAVISQATANMEFPLQIKRQYAAPIDTTSVFSALEGAGGAKEYAQSGATAYVGQIIVVVNQAENTATAYVISDTTGTLTEVGAATLGDDKSISLTDGTLSLKNFGVQYYKFVPATEEGGQATYELTQGFKAGLEPKVRLLESGGYELAWYEPNPTTVEGLLGDDKSISLTDGTLSLKNFGVQYYKFVPATEEGGQATYELTQGFKAGLEPKVRLLESGGYELAWYEPNPTTVEGLQSAVTALQGSVSTLEQNVYTKTEIDNKLDNIPEWKGIE
nr:hypothetical protein DGKKSRWO_DGKKSRWO_CDS_0184 [uncultured phage]